MALMHLLTFAAGVLAVFAGYSVISDLFLRDRSRFGKRVDEEFRKRSRDRVRKSVLFKDLAAVAAEVVPDEEAPPSLKRRLETLIDQSGLDLTVERLLLIAGTAGLGLGGIAFLLTKKPIVGLLAAFGAAVVPFVYVQAKRRARRYKLLTQLPDAFDLMARVTRAGQTMSQGLQAVADEFERPIAGEFAYCFEQQNLGLSPEMALRDLARRTGLLDIKIFVMAILVQQQTGGNLADLLDKLAGIVRERFKIQGKLSTLTAEGRFQALVLLALPPGLGLLLFAINPKYGGVLLDHPALLIYTFVSELIGAVWIRRIIAFDY